jgi:transcriptional regulator with XRE-family HTH domain
MINTASDTAIRPLTSALAYERLVAAVLVHLRRRRGIGQRALAKKLDIPQSSLSRIENGCMRLTIEELHLIAHELGSTPMKIFRVVDHINTHSLAQEVLRQASVKKLTSFLQAS